MATEQLQVSGWDSGWPNGFVSNIDDTVASPDGQFISATFVGDEVILDFDNVSTIIDADTITDIQVTVRAKADAAGLPEPGDPQLDLELYINSALKGGTKGFFISDGGWGNTVLSDNGWDSDWTAAELNTLQVSIISRGVLTTAWYIDTVEILITYTPQAPVTRDPGAETLALAGKTPSVFLQEYATPARDTLSLAGYATSLQRTFTERPDPDTLMFSGKAPATVEAWTTSVSAATLDITGYVPAETANEDFSPGPTSYALAGYVPTLLFTLNHTAHPGQGALALLPEGVAVFSGTETFVGPTRGTGAFAGQDVTFAVTTDVERVPSLGAVDLAGYAPTLNSYTLPIGEATIVLTGQGVIDNVEDIRAVPELAMSFTSYAPQTLQEFLQLELTGYAPDAVVDHFVPVPTMHVPIHYDDFERVDEGIGPDWTNLHYSPTDSGYTTENGVLRTVPGYFGARDDFRTEGIMFSNREFGPNQYCEVEITGYVDGSTEPDVVGDPWYWIDIWPMVRYTVEDDGTYSYYYFYCSPDSADTLYCGIAKWRTTSPPVTTFGAFDTYANVPGEMPDGLRLRLEAVGNVISGYIKRPTDTQWELVSQGTDVQIDALTHGVPGVGGWDYSDLLKKDIESIQAGNIGFQIEGQSVIAEYQSAHPETEAVTLLAGQAPTIILSTLLLGDPKLVSLSTRYDIEFIATPTDILIE